MAGYFHLLLCPPRAWVLVSFLSEISFIEVEKEKQMKRS